jgi:RNA polymerase sigma factor (sigma-70 family)
MLNAQSDNDRDLISPLAASNDAQLLAEVYAHNHAALVRYLVQFTRGRVLAEDLAQQAWLKIVDAFARDLCVPSGATFRSYLFTVARNIFLDECTRKHAYTRTITMDATDMDHAVTSYGEQHTPDKALQISQAKALLSNAINTLPAAQREVIKLWSNGISIEGMTRHAAAPRDTVLSRKKYALAHLRRTLESCGAPVYAF